MDSLSQLALGAAVGYVVGGKEFGKKAFVIGAIAGTLPDLDFIFTMFAKDDFSYLNYHRGFSHSIIAGLTLPFLWAYLVTLFKPKWPFKTLVYLFASGILTHLLLDCFTTWGTQALWPLNLRVAWQTIFIVDPLYTLPLWFCLAVAVFKKHPDKIRKWTLWGLILSTLYLGWGVTAKQLVAPRFNALFTHHNLDVVRFTTRPTAFNSILWSTTAETDKGYYVGYVSLLDKNFQGPLYFIPKKHELNASFHDEISDQMFALTKGYYSLEKDEQGLWIHDLRYGTMGDPWQVEEQFVFSYHLRKDAADNTQVFTVNPRDRDYGPILKGLWQRVKGI